MTDRSHQHDRPVGHVVASAPWTSLETPTGPVAYDDRGAGDTVVLLPSGAHDHHDYDELRALLPDGMRSIALDWPAHGASPPGDGPATVTRFADIAEQPRASAGSRGRGRRRELRRRVRRDAPGDPAARARARPRDRRRRRVRRPSAAGARLLLADVAAVVPAPDLPGVLGALHACAHRRRPALARHRRRDDAARPRSARRERAVGELRLAGARPARARRRRSPRRRSWSGAGRTRSSRGASGAGSPRRFPARATPSSTPATCRTRPIRRRSRTCSCRSRGRRSRRAGVGVAA